MSERETALQITERIIREHDTFCVGRYLPDAAWCSCAPSDEPLCDSCRALAEKITEAIDAAASLPPDAAPQTCEWREIATAPKDGTRVLTPWAERITDLRASIASVEGERDRLKASPCVDGSPHYCPNCDRTGYYVVSPSSAPAAQTPETTTDTVKPEVPNLMAALKKSLEQLTPTGEKDPR